VKLNPVKGKEISKIRPCLIISPDAANKHLQTVIAAPSTSAIKNITMRLHSNFHGKQGKICFVKMSAIDGSRVIKILGTLDNKERKQVSSLLIQMFSEI